MEVEDAKVAAAAPAEEIDDLSNPEVVNKSREASQIAQQVLDAVIGQIAAGKRAVDICAFGDALIEVGRLLFRDAPTAMSFVKEAL